MNKNFSKSESNGLALLGQKNLLIYSPGISTAGVAEIEMAKSNNKRKIIATSIDDIGIRTTQDIVQKAGFNNQIIIKNEDVAKKLSYQDDHFDFIYARLILHYLSRQELDKALAELFRVLKKGGKIFVVVRSTDDPENGYSYAKFHPDTCLTEYFFTDEKKIVHKDRLVYRYFHDQQTINDHLTKAGFKINSLKQYNEQLYIDFERKKLSTTVANVIEVIAEKIN